MTEPVYVDAAVTLTFLGRDVFRKALRVEPPPASVSLQWERDHENRCVFGCTNKPVLTQHGWLCGPHQLRHPRHRVEHTDNGIDARLVLAVDKPRLTEGRRVGDRFNLLRASVYKQDGTPKFPW